MTNANDLVRSNNTVPVKNIAGPIEAERFTNHVRLIALVATIGPVVWFLEWGGMPRTAQTSLLPHVNAMFNFISTCFLIAGFRAIKRGDFARHRLRMIGALVCSAEFLIGYLTYHALYENIRYTGT